MSSPSERLSQNSPEARNPFRRRRLDPDLGLDLRETRLGHIEDGIYNLPVFVQRVLKQLFPNSSGMRRVTAATNYRIDHQIPRYYVVPREGSPS